MHGDDAVRHRAGDNRLHIPGARIEQADGISTGQIIRGAAGVVLRERDPVHTGHGADFIRATSRGRSGFGQRSAIENVQSFGVVTVREVNLVAG